MRLRSNEEVFMPNEPYVEQIMVADGDGDNPDVEEVKYENIHDGGGGGTNLDSLPDSTNDISDTDLIVSKENNGWVKKTALKIWNYVKTKLGISDQGSTGKYLDEQGNFTIPPNTTYDAMTSSELSTGTATTLRTMRADYAKDGIKQLMLDMCYPVGSIYTSTKNVSPATFLGGTWKSHSDYILRGATSNVSFDDNSNTGNGFGGSDTVTLTGVQSGLKGHGHGFTQPTVNGGATNTGWISADHGHSGTTGGMDRSTTHTHGIGMHSDSGVVGNNAWAPIDGQSGKTYSLGGPSNGGGHIYARVGTGAGITDYADTNHLHGFSTGGVNANHYHAQNDHTHSVSGGAVWDASASNATSAHSIVQRYKNVYIWERTA